MYSLSESLTIVGTAVFAWWALHDACVEFWHRPWIANAGAGALIVIGALLSLIDELRKRRSTGNWFLTDRATGCEYAAPSEEATDA